MAGAGAAQAGEDQAASSPFRASFSRMIARVPLPGSPCSSMRPPCGSTIRFTVGRPGIAAALGLEA
jgi:hypothetical protein